MHKITVSGVAAHTIVVLAFLLVVGFTPAATAGQGAGTPAAAAGPTTDAARVPIEFLRGKQPQTHHRRDGLTRTSSRSRSGVPGIDSIANWTDQFIADGFDDVGNPKSVWPYSMVGAPPESGRTTRIHAPIIPVTVELLDASGRVGRTSTGAPLRTIVTRDIIDDVKHSPVFERFKYTSGTGQFNDQLMRAQFFERIGHRRDDGDDDDDDGGWHTLLRPTVETTRVMRIPRGFYLFAENADGTCCAFVLADFTTFANLLFPATPADTTTVIGAAEHAGDMTTRDITTLLFNNVFLFDGDPGNCCILGFHSYDLEPGDARNGNRERRFVMDFASWISNGLFSFGFEDITAFSHEMSEIFADPFVDNATPWWLSVDPFFGFSLCQNNLENADVVEVLSSNPVHAIPMHGRTYHPQNVALFSWFAFQSPSTAHLKAYSFPDETTVTALSPGPLRPGCVP